MSMDHLRGLFVQELRDILSAEKQLTKALPKLAAAAHADDLRAGFEQHLAETDGQIERLQKVFELIGETARAKACKAMEGLIEEGAEIIDKEGDQAVKDAALICAAQKAEHYEIAAYGTLVTWAEQLGFEEAARLLSQSLEEEKATDVKLTELATNWINVEAAS